MLGRKDPRSRLRNRLSEDEIWIKVQSLALRISNRHRFGVFCIIALTPRGSNVVAQDDCSSRFFKIFAGGWSSNANDRHIRTYKLPILAHHSRIEQPKPPLRPLHASCSRFCAGRPPNIA